MRLSTSARYCTAVSLFTFTILLGGLALAAPNGNGNGKGKSGGGSPDLGDMIVLYRDATGVPILTSDFCQQPLAPAGVTVKSTIDGTVACTPSSPDESCTIPVDPATCALVPGYETYTQEVDFGRSSVVRSPESVLVSQLDDVIVNLSAADCASLDPSGRLVTSVVTDGTTTSAAIDSPLQNLAIYRQMMLTGYLGSQASPIALPDDGNPQHILNTAARALGAASDKTGKVTVDMVAYLNQIMGLTDPTTQTILPKRCIDVKEEVQGKIEMVQKCFLDYSGFSYDRSVNFSALPDPAYIPASSPTPGWFEYLAKITETPTFGIAQGPIIDAVPLLAANSGLTATSLVGFAQAADDSRAVIDFMHTWPLPADYATPLTCSASGAIDYDVSISSDSGLQVPVKMVAGTEGREFTLTVANAGPDDAAGTAIVDATDATGNTIPTFPRTFSFKLNAGTSTSWTESFSVDYATEVTWTATAEAPHDVNMSNNSVTETTVVTGGRSGGKK